MGIKAFENDKQKDNQKQATENHSQGYRDAYEDRGMNSILASTPATAKDYIKGYSLGLLDRKYKKIN